MLLPNQHHLFDIPDDVTYLNCAYISPSLKSVTEAGRRGMGKKSQPWSITSPDFFKESEEARSLFSQIIDSSLEDIAIIPAVSYGIAIAALNLPIKKDENVVVLEEQFPSNYYVWSENVKRANGELVVVKRPAEGS
ncbi:MAG TPA: aminotransferase, partial [Candidatus Marinimicrobia bacterium]|nr:aminotransferase [Candidatus Neomarinimicrobiota bacterium]